MLLKAFFALGLVGGIAALSMVPTGASACPAGDAQAAFVRLDAAIAKAAPNEPAGVKSLRDLARRQISSRDFLAAYKTIDQAMQALGIKTTADNGAGAAPKDHPAPLTRC